ncbi:hypothetical protein PUNSTDRAFT_64692, partial [Punctularia strigosozonata HHB-11173 SS5]|uniref:uncharacterized protein n=1 Tax=Punctularia strigosozonata (strain HHB-11173) TaxID=741275 RepID=UPI00044178AC
KFDVKDFISSVSEQLISKSAQGSGPYDPKPFIANFEAAVDKLITIRKDVQANTEQMEKSVRIAEREYSKKMAELNKGFEAVGTNFSGMESKMNEVGRTAIRIGEQLESITLERQRAQAAYDLIDYYNQFSRGDTSRLDALKKENGREGRRQVAIILRRLNTVAKEVDLPSADKTREAIDRYCERFEKEMLYLFDKSYRRGDPKLMNHVAQTLLEFNGGTSCVQVYVNQHDFFINRVAKGVDTNANSALWNSLADPDASPPKSETALADLLSEIRSTMGQEAEIVRAVFPNPPFVMQVFLQRVFAQSIQQHMESLLNRGNAISDLAFLRILQLVHVQTSALVDDLKTYELSAIVLAPRGTSEYRAATAAGVTGASGGPQTMTAMLETAMEELFVPYTEGYRYLERESKSLAELYGDRLSAFTRYHARAQEGDKSTMFGRMMTAAGATGTSSAAAAALMRFGGINKGTPAPAEKPEEDPAREEDGILSIDVAEQMLKWHAEAIGRCVELSSPNDVPKHTFSLFRVLTDALGVGYIEIALETARVRLQANDTKTEPNLSILAVLRSVDLICHLWQQYVNIALFPLASSSVVVRREMAVFNNQTVSRIEGAANAVMQLIIDTTVSWLRSQLDKQKRVDFKPRNDDEAFARVNTEPCIASCEFLERVRDAAKQHLSGRNLEIFLTEIGVAFNGLLLEHLKKFPISATGGLILAKDLKSYQDVAESFALPSLHERFEFLRELGNLFLVRPEVLKQYITENALGRIDTALLKPYLVQRADWGQVEKVFSDLGFPNGEGAGEDSIAPNSAKGLGFRDRFGGRLSTMIKDLDLDRMRLGENINMPAITSGFGGLSNRMSGMQVSAGISSGMGARMSAFAGNYSWSNGAFGAGQRTSGGSS